MKKFLKSYGGLVAVIIMLLMIAGSVFYYNCGGSDPVTPDPVLSKVVGAYTGPAVTSSHFGESSAYEMGANAKGMPVFKDTSKAFTQALIDYKQGFDAVKHKYLLLPPRKNNWKIYAVYGSQLETQDENLRTQGYLISQFFDIYENSFKS